MFDRDTILDFGVNFDILGFCEFAILICLTFTSRTASSKHVSDKVLKANDLKGRRTISCFRQKLDFPIGFAIKISIFT